MLDWIDDTTLTALVGLFGGFLLGLAARIGRFCTLGAIEDALYARSGTRLGMWGVAIGVALVGSFALMQAGLMPAGGPIYLRFAWNPWASVVGGLIFGYGMALAGNCGYGALARLGGGDLRAFVIVLVMGLSAYVSIAGPLARFRVALFGQEPADPAAPPGLAHWLSGLTGLEAPLIGMAAGAALLVALLALWPGLRGAPAALFWGAVAGLAIVSGWAGTAWVAAHGFAPVPIESHSFAAPLGETLLWLMTSSGSHLSFGVGSVMGVLAGAFVGSLFKGHFRWEACEDPRELKRQILGAALMGQGAVIAFGCSVGQGLSAMSVLYAGAPVALAAIFAGAALGLRQLIAGFAPAE